MVVTTQLKNQHLLWRAGFGPAADKVQQLATSSPLITYAALVKASNKKPQYLDVANDLFDGFFKGVGELSRTEKAAREMSEEVTKEKQKEFRRQSREGLKSLNLSWLDEMVTSGAQLREKMSLFWHGHFACRNINIFFQQLLLDDIRNNALGSFRDLLTAVSKSAGMLAFLNNQQNKKSHPNENFAREVMELFTMGRGNYSENDVKEAARAFTGWGFNLKGEYVFRKFQHDEGMKTFLGRKGNFDGDDVIKILLEQKSTATFITRKVYRYFVNEQPDEQKVKWLADRFYSSDYNISALMNDIFTSDWFYDVKNIGALIKSPVELIVGIRRILPMELEKGEVQLLMQRALGQILFYPPNVAGWPGGKNWIDSSSLMLRLRIPQLVTDNDVFNISPKTDDDQQMGMKDEGNGFKKQMKVGNGMLANNRFRINADVNWQQYIKQFESVSRTQLYDVMEAVMLQTSAGSVPEQSVEKVADKTTRENYIKTVAIALMSTPEYQLC